MDQSMTDKIDALISGMATLTADMKHVREKTDAIDNKVQTLNDKSIVTEMTALRAHQRLDEIVPLVTAHEKIFIEQGGGKKAVSGIWAIITSIGAMLTALGSLLFK